MRTPSSRPSSGSLRFRRAAARSALLVSLGLGSVVAPSQPADALVAPNMDAPAPDVRALTRTLANRRTPTPERVAAAQALGSAQDAQARRGLERALRDREPEVRAAAARSLGMVGDARSLAALRRLRPDSVAYVRAQVGHAVARLTGDTTPRARVRVGNISVSEGALQPDRTTEFARAEATRMLGSLPRTEVHTEVPPRPDDHSPDAVLRAADGVIFLRLEVAVTHLSYTVENNVATVRAEVQLALTNDPGLMIRAVDNTSASVRANVNVHNTERQRQQMLEAALRSAITGAARNLDGGIEDVFSAR
ncbi:MAG: HEAT repeat domain-containing protein [Sandaracinaceae bacterium]|nr:HEAT repeat domain-containing protein [Myxococcales bacterium]MCB9661513.1 HEAT repeat domain-containing protein [Sandaracinaceae bacterium]